MAQQDDDFDDMPQFVDEAWDDVSQVSSDGEEVLNQEDIQIDDESFDEEDIPPADVQHFSFPEDDLESDESGSVVSEEHDSSDENDSSDDHSSWRFIQYGKKRRGILNCASHEGSPCRPHHLRDIKRNLRLFRQIILIDSVGGAACHPMIEMLYSKCVYYWTKSTKRELKRLRNHPELFPSREIGEEFWHDIYETCNETDRKLVPILHAYTEEIKQIEAVTVEDERDIFLPVRDMERKPWEQYLHDRAPGVEADLSNLGKEGSVQVFPMAAVRIVMGMVDENRAIISDIESQREDGVPYQEIPMAGLYAKKERLSCDGHLRSHQTTGELLQPIIAGSMNASRSLTLNSLEVLNQDFGESQNLKHLDEMLNYIYSCPRRT